MKKMLVNLKFNQKMMKIKRRRIQTKINKILKKRKQLPQRKTVVELRLINSFSKDVYKEFQRQKRATLKWLKDKNILSKLFKYFKKHYPELYEKDISEDDLTILNKFIKDWKKNVKPENMEKVLNYWMSRAAAYGGLKALQELGIDLSFNLKDRKLLKSFKDRGKKITGGISKKTLKDFRNILKVAYLEEGISPYEVAKRIKGLFEETYKNRAMIIARTETAISSSTTQFETYKKNGIKFKMWLAVVDERTRDSHEYVNGQVVRIDEFFDVMGTPMMHPHDPTAPAREVISCRCDHVAIIENWNEPAVPWNGQGRLQEMRLRRQQSKAAA